MSDYFSQSAIDKVRLGIDNNRLTALLCAVLDAQGGAVLLTKEQAERVWEGASINYAKIPGGGISIKLVPRKEPPPIRQREV